ncbi:PLD nuclease N-terminal domain-containing protein [Streptomyces roseicoloratus]|uniref:PLD nuclease N-terminal domain-containing protein n=1 Tax=Streptomyces roseicoloratus TaxID=2508722 RepID=A0ABY9RWH3_9ACTN|nr:PLD nuclease N-terminal domain-containing protein [Streptomyces roseicoloratus]WMX46526.1 PLD nuclease N-terminal domain-containing protein [Streptomyces roseicoloratus]
MLRALMFILPLALVIYSLIDCLNTPEDEVKHLPKVVWVIIILLFWIVGPIVWFAAGKLRRGPAGGSTPSAWHRNHRPEWVAPDDNPEFLKSLREEAVPEEKGAKDESLLKDWEADLRRHEEELKRREQGDGTQRGEELRGDERRGGTQRGEDVDGKDA